MMHVKMTLHCAQPDFPCSLTYASQYYTMTQLTKVGDADLLQERIRHWKL
jgi:hypothetical protein